MYFGTRIDLSKKAGLTLRRTVDGEIGDTIPLAVERTVEGVGVVADGVKTLAGVPGLGGRSIDVIDENEVFVQIGQVPHPLQFRQIGDLIGIPGGPVSSGEPAP